jgi:hypothetical protein
MKQLLVLAAALGLLGACKDKKEAPAEGPKPAPRDAAAAKPEETVLLVNPSAPAIGMTIDRTDDSRSTMKIGGEEMEETEKQVSRSTVLAVMGPAIAKLEVAYQTHDVLRRAGSQQEQSASPLAGKTYQVWVEGDELKATGADGKPVSDEELALLKDDHVELGKVPQIEQLLAARDWKLGEQVDLSVEQLASLGQARGGGTRRSSRSAARSPGPSARATSRPSRA